MLMLGPRFMQQTQAGGGHDGADPGGLVAVGLGSIEAVPHEVQRRRETQGLLVRRKTMACRTSVTASDNDGRWAGGGGVCKLGVLAPTGRSRIKHCDTERRTEKN